MKFYVLVTVADSVESYVDVCADTDLLLKMLESLQQEGKQFKIYSKEFCIPEITPIIVNPAPYVPPIVGPIGPYYDKFIITC